MQTLIGQSRLALACLLVTSVSARVASCDDTRKRLVTEAPRAWKKIATVAEHMEVKMQTRFGRDDFGMLSNWHCKISGNNALILTTPDQSLGVEQVFCRNKDYSFALTRRGPTEVWSVKKYGKTPYDDVDDMLGLLSIKSLSQPQLCMYPFYLPDIFVANLSSSEPSSRDRKPMTLE